MDAVRGFGGLLAAVPLVGAAWGPGAGGGVLPIRPYPSGATGYDISWPQCGGRYPPRDSTIAVVGVNDGRAFTANPCLASEAAWAGGRLSLYLNIDSPQGPDPTRWMEGPAGACGPSDLTCQGYNFGWNAAAWSVSGAAAAGVQAATWWIDVETANYWSPDTSANAAVVRGAIDALTTRALAVAVYSTDYQWHRIVGAYQPAVPAWVATGGARDPASHCRATAFTGGSTWLVQYGSGPYDDDYAC